MNITNCWMRRIGIACGSALLGFLAGCNLYQEPYGGGYYEPAGPADAAYAEIGSVNDFYGPLSPYGQWVVVAPYGRCWVPGGVDAGWSPYSNGYWQDTDAGWYWDSDEPWGWATYHYGRWDWESQFGWFWVPQTEWAPAWVCWRQGGGYVGWAPLGPSMRAGERGGPSRGYVFVEERRFLDPVRSAMVRANGGFMNRTADLTRTHTMNRAVFNEGPGAAAIEQASGRRIQAAPVRELRSRDEARFSAKHQSPVQARPPNTQGQDRNEAPSPERRSGPAHEPRQVEKPTAPAVAPHPPAVKRDVPPPEQHRVTKPAEVKGIQPRSEGPKPAPTPGSTNNSRPDAARHTANEGPPQPKEAGRRPEQPPARPEISNQKAPPVSESHAKPEPAKSDQNGKSATRDDRTQRDQN